MSDSTLSDRNYDHLHPTAHQASWVVDQNRLTALDAAVQRCQLPLPAAAPAAGPAAGNAAIANAVPLNAPATGPAGAAITGLPAAGHVAPPGAALPTTNNAAPVAPGPGLVATGSITAGAQGQTNPAGPAQAQTNPPGAGQGQADQPNDEDDAIDQLEEEEEEKEEEEEEQDDQSSSATDPAALVTPAHATDDDPATAGTQDQTNPPGLEQGQADQPIVIDEDNHISEQDAEYEDEFGLNYPPGSPGEYERFLNARYERGTSSVLTKVFFLLPHTNFITEQSLRDQPVNPHFHEEVSAQQDANRVERNFLSRADFGPEYQ